MCILDWPINNVRIFVIYYIEIKTTMRLINFCIDNYVQFKPIPMLLDINKHI